MLSFPKKGPYLDNDLFDCGADRSAAEIQHAGPGSNQRPLA